jgi:hypothetical protein
MVHVLACHSLVSVRLVAAVVAAAVASIMEAIDIRVAITIHHVHVVIIHHGKTMIHETGTCVTFAIG